MNAGIQPSLFDRPAAAREELAPIRVRSLLSWTPPAVALIVVAQVALLGLRPALEESRRLAREETALDHRSRMVLDALAEYAEVARAQEDPIYLERERKWMLVQGEERTGP